MRRKLFSEKTHQLVCVSPISSQVPKDLVVLNLPKKCSHLKSFKLHLLLVILTKTERQSETPISCYKCSVSWDHRYYWASYHPTGGKSHTYLYLDDICSKAMTPLIYYHFPNIFGLPHISLLDVVRRHREGHSCGGLWFLCSLLWKTFFILLFGPLCTFMLFSFCCKNTCSFLQDMWHGVFVSASSGFDLERCEKEPQGADSEPWSAKRGALTGCSLKLLRLNCFL